MGTEAFTPRRLNDALQYLHKYGDETVILAGGTDILVRYHNRLDEINKILNICELEELKNIKIVKDEIEIGSLVTHTQLEESTIIQEYAPFLSDAAASIGSPQIRNRGTIGGNIANASPAGDTLTPLLVLDAKVRLLSLEQGERELPLSEFFLGPGRHQAKKNELIAGVKFSANLEKYRGFFIKLGYRKALAISTVNVAVLLHLEDKIIKECRIALGSVAPIPKRARLVEEFLQGTEYSEEFLEEALKHLDKDISPISDIRGSRLYRLKIARELVARAIAGIISEEVKEGGR